MKPKKISIKISAAVGKVSGILLLPEKAAALFLLAHGAGAGMTHLFMEDLSAALAQRNIATLRFNFPYMEAGKKRPDTPAIAHLAVDAALKQALKLTKNKISVFLSGKSFGGRMSSQYLSEHPDANVQGIIFFGFPLHAPGKHGIDRAEHLKKIKHPMLFLSGTRDEFARLDLLQKVIRKLPTATLVKIENANHGFKAPGKKDIISVLAERTESWIQKI
jgi:predicted alpha/beta-hydrolase family hydrolase